MMRSSVVALVVFLTAIATVTAQSHNPQVGIWKMNIPKSTFSSGTGFKSATVTIESVGAGVKHTVDSVYADGTSRRYQYTSAYDGKDAPVIGNSPWGDTAALTHVDANTVRTVYKSHGKVTVTQTSVVSSDRKTRTVTTRGTNPMGQAVDNVSVYERQ